MASETRMGFPAYQSLSTPCEFTFTSTNSRFVVYIYKKMVSPSEDIETRSQCIGKSLLKSIAIAAGPLARLVFIKIPIKYAGNNLALGGALVYGNIFSYGPFISWCLLKIINSSISPKSDEERNLTRSRVSGCAKIALKTAAIVVGILAQIPLAYVAYVYNGKNILCIFPPLFIDSAYPIYSVMLSSEKIIERRKLSYFENKLELIKDKMITCLNNNYLTIIRSDEKDRTAVLDRLKQVDQMADSFYEAKVQKYLEILLDSSRLPADSTDSCLVQSGRIFATVCGIVLGIAQLYFTLILSNAAAEEVTDDFIGRVVIAGTITACNAYLGVKIIVSSVVKSYDYAAEFFRKRDVRNLSHIIQPHLSHSLQLIALTTVALSFAAPLQVAEDYFEGDVEMPMEAASVVQNIILSTFALQMLIDDLIAYGSLKSRDHNKRQLVEMNTQITELITTIEKSPVIEFAQLLKILPEPLVRKWTKQLDIPFKQLNYYLRTSNLLTNPRE